MEICFFSQSMRSSLNLYTDPTPSLKSLIFHFHRGKYDIEVQAGVKFWKLGTFAGQFVFTLLLG